MLRGVGWRSLSAGSVRKLGHSDLLSQMKSGQLSLHKAEEVSESLETATSARRSLFGGSGLGAALSQASRDPEAFYSSVLGRCCENVIGSVAVPVGIAGPLLVDSCRVPVPLATTEGALVASVARGCKAISVAGACTSVMNPGEMSRAPLVVLPSAREAAMLATWVADPTNFETLSREFGGGSAHARLGRVRAQVVGKRVWLRLTAMSTGDAMGMNMLSQGCERVLGIGSSLRREFPGMRVLAVSGNACCDKKPGAINWVDGGRGVSVVSEALLGQQALKILSGTTAREMAEVCRDKCWLGSAAGAATGPGGLNAHAANIVAAIFIATGQDPAQVVVSSNCVTSMDEEECEDGTKALRASCTMRNIEVGTVGGGTQLAAQKALLSLATSAYDTPETRRTQERTKTKLARVICSAVLAGELSLLSALTRGHLTRAHLALNRAKK